MTVCTCKRPEPVRVDGCLICNVCGESVADGGDARRVAKLEREQVRARAAVAEVTRELRGLRSDLEIREVARADQFAASEARVKQLEQQLAQACDPSHLADLIAERVAERLAPDAVPELMTAEQKAAQLGLTADTVRRNASRYGGVKLGDGPRAPWRFPRTLPDADNKASADLRPEPTARRSRKPRREFTLQPKESDA